MTCISTVGYGDYVPNSSVEVMFTLFLELVGFITFGIMMSTVADAFNSSFSFQSYVNEKNIYFNLWMKKLEKSNKPNFMSVHLYEDARHKVESSFSLDFNTII